MALAQDASSPALVSQTNGATSALTTGSFTPPTGALLLVCWGGNAGATENPSQPTITDSLGAHLTYTLINWRNHADSGGASGQAAMWWAVVGSSAAMTVTVNNLAVSGQRFANLRVVVITGQDATTPVGNSGEASAGSGTFSQAVTSSISGDWSWAVWGDWQVGSTTFTAGTGCTKDASGTAGGNFNTATVKRTTADGAGSGTNTLSLTSPTSNAQNWVYTSVKPASGSDATATPAVVAATAAVGAVTLRTDSTITPATAAGSVAVSGTATVSVTSAPATVAGTATVGAVTVSAGSTVAAATVAAAAAIPAPSVTAGGSATATVSTVAGTVAIGSPTLHTGETVAVGVVAGVATVGAPTITTTALATPATVAGVVAVGATTLHTGEVVQPATVAAAVAVGAPVVTGGGSATALPATVAAVATVGAAQVSVSRTVGAGAVSATVAIGTPTVTTVTIVAVATVAARVTIPAPTLTAAAALLVGTLTATARNGDVVATAVGTGSARAAASRTGGPG